MGHDWSDKTGSDASSVNRAAFAKAPLYGLSSDSVGAVLAMVLIASANITGPRTLRPPRGIAKARRGCGSSGKSAVRDLCSIHASAS